MKKLKMFVGVIALVLVSAICLTGCSSKEDNAVKLDTVEDMTKVIEQIYEKTKLELMSLETREVEIDDEFTLAAATGLSSKDKISKVVISEPMISSIPYSLVMVKVNKKSDVEKVKQEMVDNIDMRKWMCVNADVLYATSYEDVIFVVYASEENAKPQYDEFKNIVGKNIGKEISKNFEE